MTNRERLLSTIDSIPDFLLGDVVEMAKMISQNVAAEQFQKYVSVVGDSIMTLNGNLINIRALLDALDDFTAELTCIPDRAYAYINLVRREADDMQEKLDRLVEKV